MPHLRIFLRLCQPVTPTAPSSLPSTSPLPSSLPSTPLPFLLACPSQAVYFCFIGPLSCLVSLWFGDIAKNAPSNPNTIKIKYSLYFYLEILNVYIHISFENCKYKSKKSTNMITFPFFPYFLKLCNI